VCTICNQRDAIVVLKLHCNDDERDDESNWRSSAETCSYLQSVVEVN
jgi:hypothetical protein